MRGLLIVVTLLGMFVRASIAAPTAITFTVLHADCNAPGSHSLAFTLNDVLLGTAPTTQDCVCNSDPLVVTFSDPASLAHFDPATCNRLRVDVLGSSDSLLLGYVRVTVTDGGGPLDGCLFDGWASNANLRCDARSLCAGAFFDSGVTTTGGADADGDGVVAGVGVGCDGCPSVPNPDQADGDGDGVDDACDDCPAVADPQQTDTDGDGTGNVCDPCPNGDDMDADGHCDDVDDCPEVSNPDQADADGDGFGDVCDGCLGQGTTDADADGACDEADVCPVIPDPAQTDGDGDGLGDACDNCSVFNPGQEDGNGDGVADACSPGVSIAGIAAADGVIEADVRVTSPLARPLTGTVRIVDDGGVTGLVFTWLATSCAPVQDTLDLIVNGTTVAKVAPEPGGSSCVCTPAVGSFTVPLAEAVTLLRSGVNQLGIRKSTTPPAMPASAIAWAYATLTAGGTAQRVDIFDMMGGNDFDNPDLCIAAYSFEAIEVTADTTALPPFAMSLAWSGELPCGVDLSPLAPNRSYVLAVSASDGLVGAPSADARGFDRGAESLLTMTGATCDDANPCTTDSCTAHGCVHVPVVCGAVDACHAAGVCDPTTGTCTSPDRPDGTTCDDGNACTQNDACRAGTCTGGEPVVCGAADQCHAAGVCDPTTGTCSSPARSDGTACDDGNACTQNDACRAGACTSGAPIVCAPADACHEAGVCNPETGMCTNPARPDGTTCNDGNACTRHDTCRTGTCTGSEPVVCGAGDQCHEAGVCNPETGMCTNPARPDGTTCNDGNACTRSDVCRAGACTGGEPVVCGAGDQCHETGVCNPETGMCTNPARPDGTTCNDGNACTRSDVCRAGACTGGEPVVCGAGDQCHEAGVCNPETGMCTNPARPDGTTCNDGNACTRSDVCHAGSCTGSEPVVCGAGDQCHEAGVCNPATGMCTNPARPDGTTCNDGNACTRSDVCRAGTCTGGEPVVCAAADQCHAAGVCNPSTGMCTSPTRPDGTACNDGNACTQSDVCRAGTCAGGAAVVCAPADECHAAGVCDPGTGVCSSRPDRPDGTTCDDGNACTQSDVCRQGRCVGQDPVVCVAPDACHEASCKRHDGTCQVKRTMPQRFCLARGKAKPRELGRRKSPGRR